MSELQNPYHSQHNFRSHHTAVILAMCVFVFISGFVIGKLITTHQFAQKIAELTIKGTTEEKTYPLLKYSFSELAKRGGVSSEITLDRELYSQSEFTAYVFHYISEGRKISGQINIPNSSDPTVARPVILLMRGYVDPVDYTIGKGTSPSATTFASAGYITIAPDFLGYGESDMPPGETFAERFIKPMNILDLFASVDALDQQELTFENKSLATIDAKKIGLWGHSNGGQIALSFLEITGRNVPTVLLAPVSKFFPYSVLYFIDESEDKGTGMIGAIAKFEQDYNINEYTIGNRLDNISAKIQLHQGSEDVEVPQLWSDEFYSYFAGKGKKDQIEYFVYPGANHLLVPATETVKDRALSFFNDEVKNKKPEPTATPTASASATPSVTPEVTLFEATDSATPIEISE